MKAFEELYSRYFERMLKLAKKRLAQNEKAQEAVQNTFFRLHSWRHKYNPKYLVAQWVFVILRSEINKVLKDPHALTFDEKPLHLLTLSQNSPEESIGFKEQLSQIESQLSQEEMDLLHMRYIDGLAFEEISDLLGLNATNIRQKVSRLIKKIRRIRK